MGRIEVSAPSLYQEIRTSEQVELNLSVKNTGTRVIHNVHISTESPISWRTFITPDTVPLLEPNQEEIVKLKVLPPSDAGVGDYEVKIKTDAISNNRKVPTVDQTDRKRSGLLAGAVLKGIGAADTQRKARPGARNPLRIAVWHHAMLHVEGMKDLEGMLK